VENGKSKFSIQLMEVSNELGDISRILLLAIGKSSEHKTLIIEEALERLGSCQQTQLHKLRKIFEELKRNNG